MTYFRPHSSDDRRFCEGKAIRRWRTIAPVSVAGVGSTSVSAIDSPRPWRRLTPTAWLLLFLVGAGWSPEASAQSVGDAAQNQWFTGSLVAPSPALSKAGAFAIEPYAVYTANTGVYDKDWGHHSVPNELNQAQSVTLLKYGITDELSVQALPSLSYQWNDQTTSGGIGLDDLSVELQYRIKNGDIKTGSPSATIDLGMTLPTGAYDRLHSPLDGVGAGAYMAKEGLLFQSLFDTWGDHAMRLRLFGAAYEPLANVSVHDVSVYGTDQGFQGRATPGFSAQGGFAVEYGLDQRWVLALDLVQNYADGFVLNGASAVGGAVHASGGSSTSFALAPAIEYNWSGNLGIIAGVEFSIAGRNSSSYIAPQVAVSMAF
jgi:hypothetical protein